MQMTPEQIVLLLGLILAVWYGVASFYSRRLGVRNYRWLQAGFETLSPDKPTARWIGSSASGAQIQLERAAPPFQQVELTFLLETRELAPLWLIQRLAGRRDQLFFKATFRRTFKGTLEIAASTSSEIRTLGQDQQRTWNLEAGPHGLTIAHHGRAGSQMASQVRPLLETYGPHIKRISWGPDRPQLLIIFMLPGLVRLEAATLFRDVRTAFSPAGGAAEPADDSA